MNFPAKNSTILYIEDDHDTRVSIRQVLEAEGYQVLTAADGLSGLKLIRGVQKRPALVLLDLAMPLMDGREVLKVLKTDSALSQIPVVVISAQGSLAVELEVVQDAQEFIRKPVSLNVLADIAKRYCA